MQLSSTTRTCFTIDPRSKLQSVCPHAGFAVGGVLFIVEDGEPPRGGWGATTHSRGYENISPPWWPRSASLWRG